MRCRYHEVKFPKIFIRHPIARPLGRCMECLLWVDCDIYSASVTEVMHAISWYTELCYNGTRLYYYRKRNEVSPYYHRNSDYQGRTVELAYHENLPMLGNTVLILKLAQGPFGTVWVPHCTMYLVLWDAFIETGNYISNYSDHYMRLKLCKPHYAY